MKIYAIIMIILISSCALAQENWGEATRVDNDNWWSVCDLGPGFFSPAISTNDSILVCQYECGFYGTGIGHSDYYDHLWRPPVHLVNLSSYAGTPFFHDANDTVLYFSLRVDPDNWNNDIFTARYEAGEYTEVWELDPVINTSANETSPSITSDGLKFYFMRDDMIMCSDIVEGDFTEPYPLPELINGPLIEHDPCISPDGTKLYFNRAPDLIWSPSIILYSNKIDDVWQEPTPLNDHINYCLYNPNEGESSRWGYSFGADFSRDGQKLYFAHAESPMEEGYGLFCSELTVDVPEKSAPLPQTIAVSAFPNPFNAETRITISGDLRLVDEVSIYDITGSKVRTLKVAGSVIWDSKDNRGRDVASGLYFVKVGGDDFMEVEKLTLVR